MPAFLYPATAISTWASIMPNSPYGRVKELFEKIRHLEDKLEKASFLPMKEQQAIHAQIGQLKAEIARLEKMRK